MKSVTLRKYLIIEYTFFSFNKCSMTAYYVSGTIFGIRDIGVNKTDKAPCHGSVYILMTKLMNK